MLVAARDLSLRRFAARASASFADRFSGSPSIDIEAASDRAAAAKGMTMKRRLIPSFSRNRFAAARGVERTFRWE